MPITDPVSSVYMNNMYVTGGNSAVTGMNNASSLANATQANTSSSSSALTSSFTDLLSSMMTMNAASSIGSFADSSSGGDYMGLMGGGSSSMLGGMGGSSESSMLMVLLLYMLVQQNSKNNSGSSDSVLNALTGNTTNTAAQTCNHTNNSYVASGGTQGIPTQSWVVANPPLTNTAGNRSTAAYRAVIDQFNVENNARYTVNKNGTGDTYCNVFAWDVTRAMGAEIPHYVNANGVPQTAGGSGIEELNANQVNNWLNTYGPQYGWVKVSAEEAQFYANNGMPAVTSWKNPSGHGHLQVVSPSQDGQYNSARGVAIAQAGRQLKNYDYIDSVYGSGTLPKVEYFVHV